MKGTKTVSKYKVIGYIDKISKKTGRNIYQPVFKEESEEYFVQRVDPYTGKVIQMIPFKKIPLGFQQMEFNEINYVDEAYILYRNIDNKIILTPYLNFLGFLITEFKYSNFYSPDPLFYYEASYFFRVPLFEKKYEEQYLNYLKSQGIVLGKLPTPIMIELNEINFKKVIDYYLLIIMGSNKFISFKDIFEIKNDILHIGYFKIKIDKLKELIGLLDSNSEEELRSSLKKYLNIKKQKDKRKTLIVKSFAFDNNY